MAIEVALFSATRVKCTRIDAHISRSDVSMDIYYDVLDAAGNVILANQHHAVQGASAALKEVLPEPKTIFALADQGLVDAFGGTVTDDYDDVTI